MASASSEMFAGNDVMVNQMWYLFVYVTYDGSVVSSVATDSLLCPVYYSQRADALGLDWFVN